MKRFSFRSVRPWLESHARLPLRLLLCLAAGPVFLLFQETASRSSLIKALLWFYYYPTSAAFNLVLIYSILALCLAFLGKTAISLILTGTLLGLLTLVNFLKLAYLQSPFYPWDLLDRMGIELPNHFGYLLAGLKEYPVIHRDFVMTGEDGSIDAFENRKSSPFLQALNLFQYDLLFGSRFCQNVLPEPPAEVLTSAPPTQL